MTYFLHFLSLCAIGIKPLTLVNVLPLRYQWGGGGESAASFCHQLAALFPDLFCNFYLVKNHKIANNSATTKAREKISANLESLEI
jgi:hypothetical protein